MKSLKNLMLGIGLAGIIGSCKVNQGTSSTSVYNTKIDEDSVRYVRVLSKKNIKNIIEVNKPGKSILYYDSFGNDLVIESVEVIENGYPRVFYNHNEIEKPVVDEAQKQFNNYMKKINDPKIILK